MIFRLKKKKEELSCVGERFGIAGKQVLDKFNRFVSQNKNNSKKIAWLHAVSVGESLSVIDFVNKLCDNGWFVVFTTTTTTSANLIRKKLPQNACHQYNPYPHKRYIKKFISTWQPDVAFFVESEIFPNILSILKSKNIRSYLINARMSNKSFNRWKKIIFYIKHVLQKYECIYTQSDIETKKFKILSNGHANIMCFGNMKIDTTISAKNKIIKDFQTQENISAIIAKCKILLQNIKQDDNNKQILVFGSIHEEEFLHLIWQYSMIEKHIKCVGIFVPRYIEESEQLKSIAKKNGLHTTMWSSFCGGKVGDIVIIDELGVLLNMYYISDFSIVCGNFSDNIGGHNAVEPIAFEKPTFVGPYCTKCQDIIDDLLSAHAIVQTKKLCEDLLSVIKHDVKKTELINNGKKFIAKNVGATEKIYKNIFIENK